MTFDQKEALRAVIVAARKWREDTRRTGEEPEPESVVALSAAVDALEAALPAVQRPNAPYGFVLPRPWNLVPAGWFVRVPNGEWYEVIGTRLVDGKQHVTMKSPAGKTGTFPRDPEQKVSVRRGTHTKELSDAIEALGEAFGAEILDDSPPWDES